VENKRRETENINENPEIYRKEIRELFIKQYRKGIKSKYI
jgi:hypothetical protein